MNKKELINELKKLGSNRATEWEVRTNNCIWTWKGTTNGVNQLDYTLLYYRTIYATIGDKIVEVRMLGRGQYEIFWEYTTDM